MKNNINTALRTTLTVMALMSMLSGCRTFGSLGIGWGPDQPPPPPHHGKGPPPHAPAHGYRAKHMYHYYPADHVYFDVGRNVYFHIEGGSWRASTSLPPHLHGHLGGYVQIEVEGDAPYVDFDKHKRKYPPGQYKKNKYKKKKKY